MPDYIEIKDLLIRTIIGINPEERENRQDVLLNLKFEVDTHVPGASDNIDDAVNYRTICKRVFQFAEGSHFRLVEKLAEEVAAICLSDARIKRVWVTVEKPVPCDSPDQSESRLSVLEMMTDPEQTVFISLGSNVEPEANLLRAVRLLKERVSFVKASSVWESEPVGFTEQPPFLNAAILAKTFLPARELKFNVLRSIESQLQRVRNPLNKNGPRTIDLDIALYGNEIIHEPDLIIPDPEIPVRPFLLNPLAELDPEFLHPVLKRTLSEIARDRGIDSGMKLHADLNLNSSGTPQQFQ